LFYVFSKILDIALSPLSWGLVLIVWGAPLTKRALRRRRVRPLACALGVLVIFVFSLEPVANGLFGHLEDLAVRTDTKDKTYDVVVLLGGVVDDRAMEKSGGMISFNDNVERLLDTAVVMQEGRARYVIVSGGAVDDTRGFVEAKVLADALVRLGIARERIIIEDKAMNTRDNATYSADIARARGFSKMLIVTSAFHMRRARACFEKVGLDVDTLPVDYRTYSTDKYSGSWLPRASNLERSTAALREMSGYYIYRARGYAR
jgi:uncharacterized SAM-binding protein YcdF (DUF218 family)